MEKLISPRSGWLLLLAELVLLIIIGFATQLDNLFLMLPVIITCALLFILVAAGFVAIEPNSSRVLNLFGKYIGTIKQDGFFWINPFYAKKKISLRANNFDTKAIKVNDKQGNPIMIGAVVVWKVENTFKAAFDVDKYHSFVETQSEAAIRKLAGSFSYDNWEDEEAQITLRSSTNEVNELLEQEVSDRLVIAGINVIETRISHLAYSTEIAGAMLQRQQASAIVAARSKIVEGAVGMVEMALDSLSKKDIVHLDEERKAAMVSNLLVVLCSERTTPVVNAGTLYQ
jgi:regulator of protease activity HflC (stomatin/prohibitin superfamily)